MSSRTSSVGASGCPHASILWSADDPQLTKLKIGTADPATNMMKPDHWFHPDANLAQVVATRKAIYAARPDEVLQTGEGYFFPTHVKRIRAAARELLTMQAAYLAEHFPEQYRVDPDGRWVENLVTGDRFDMKYGKEHPLAMVGLLCQEDVLLVRRLPNVADEASDKYQLAAGFLATPTQWSLKHFMGRTVHNIHRNVFGYREHLRGTVGKLLDRPLASAAARTNAFLFGTAELSLDPKAGYTMDTRVTRPAKQVSLRSEYETFLRLPNHPEFVVMTLKPRVWSLEAAASRRGADLFEALESPDKHNFKQLPGDEKIRAYVAKVAAKNTAEGQTSLSAGAKVRPDEPGRHRQGHDRHREQHQREPERPHRPAHRL